MGMDSVEAILSVEDAFGIDIPDEAATNMLTFQNLIDYIVEHVPTMPQEKCHTQRIFCKLRRAFRNQIPALAGDFRLQTKLKNILHKDQWSKVWTAVREEAGESYWPEMIPWPGFLLKRGPATIRELVYHIAFNLPKPDAKLGEPWTRERIALEIREIISDVLGVVDFRQNADFVKDLQFD